VVRTTPVNFRQVCSAKIKFTTTENVGKSIPLRSTWIWIHMRALQGLAHRYVWDARTHVTVLARVCTSWAEGRKWTDLSYGDAWHDTYHACVQTQACSSSSCWARVRPPSKTHACYSVQCKSSAVGVRAGPKSPMHHYPSRAFLWHHYPTFSTRRSSMHLWWSIIFLIEKGFSVNVNKMLNAFN
jgi:hypothetical protein